MRHATVRVNGIDLACARHGRAGRAAACSSCTAFPNTPAPGTRCCRPSRARSTPWRPTSAAMRAPPSRRGSRPTASSTWCATSWGWASSFSPGRPFVLVAHDWGASVAYATAIAAPSRIAKLVVINGVHPGPFQRALVEDEAQRQASAYMHYLRDPQSRGAPLRQQFREAAGHAEPLRPAALADAGEARRLPRGLVAAGRADRHAQLVSGLAAGGAEAGRGGRSGEGARSSTRRSSGCACRISSSGAWTTGRCCPSRAPRFPTTATISPCARSPAPTTGSCTRRPTR